MTQERLAWDADLHKAYLSQVESGKRLPSLIALAALARALGVELVDLLVLDAGPHQQLLDAVRRKDGEAVRRALKRAGIG